jgi:glycosyltransferase involved in cell wall biosynthesis
MKITQLTAPPPDVSVVMSVHNDRDSLAGTLDSILSQDSVLFEFIVVNDGSTDGSGDLLDDYARRDSRMRVIHQENTGLTLALIRGCAAARGRFIARQDADDISLPGRLARQFAFLEANPEMVMTACGMRRIGLNQEILGEFVQNGDELHQGLGKLNAAELSGPPHHGSVMFRRSAYQAAGGYRAAFRVAQDLDLWLRLWEVGKCLAIPDILYEASWRMGAISHLRRDEQLQSTGVLLACARARRAGASDAPLLEQWERKCSTRSARRPSAGMTALDEARYYYFLAGSMRRSAPARARAYYAQALWRWPFYLRAWVWLLLLSFKRQFGNCQAR